MGRSLRFVGFGLAVGIVACSQPRQAADEWRVALRHDEEGTVVEGDRASLVAALRAGCRLRVGWGAGRQADPTRTIEHVADPTWVSIRDGGEVEVQIGEFLINLPVLGERAEDHPERGRFGGTEHAVFWRANLKTDGTFDAVWYRSSTGEFVTRVPQTHPMSWFVDCERGASTPLFD